MFTPKILGEDESNLTDLFVQMGESQESQVLRVKISAYRIPGLKEVAILKTLLGKWTQLEDVFPNENGDIPNVNGGY